MKYIKDNIMKLLAIIGMTMLVSKAIYNEHNSVSIKKYNAAVVKSNERAKTIEAFFDYAYVSITYIQAINDTFLLKDNTFIDRDSVFIYESDTIAKKGTIALDLMMEDINN